MLKKPIAILDMGLEGVYVLETLTKNFPNESFVYTNDLEYFPYDSYKKEEVLNFVNEKLEFLNTYEPKMILIVSDTIFELCYEDFKEREKIVFLAPNIIQYVNSKYSYKSMLLLARKSIIEANLYQKFLKHSQLTSIASDDIETILNNGNVKTSKTFKEVEKIMLSVQKKEIDLIISSSPFVFALKTEFLEYFPNAILLDVAEALFEIISTNPTNSKRKGKVIISTILSKKDFIQKTRWLNIKYKYKQFLSEKVESRINFDKIIEQNIKE